MWFFCFSDAITLFKKLIRKNVSYLHPDRRNLSIDEPTSLLFFLFQESLNAQDVLENFFAQRNIIFESQIDPWRKQ